MNTHPDASHGLGAVPADSIRLSGRIGPSGRLELSVPGLAEGQEVDVILKPKSSAPTRSILDIVAELGDERTFSSAEEIDAYLKAERDSWDR